MARITAISDEVDGCLNIKTTFDIAPRPRVVAIGGRPEYANNMTTNFVRAAFDRGTAVTLRKPFEAWQLVAAVDRFRSVAAFAKFVA